MSKTRTLLLVEDDQAVRESLAQLLIAENYKVISAGSLQEAIIAYGSEPADLVILDLNLGEDDGWAVFDVLRGLRHDLPIIITSAHACRLKHSAGRGARALLEKPFDPSVLLGLVKEECQDRTVRPKVSRASCVVAAFLAVCFPLLSMGQSSTIKNLQIQNGIATLNWQGGGATNQAQYRSSLDAPWQDLDIVTASPSVSHVVTEPAMFYRVLTINENFSISADKKAPSTPTGLTASAVGCDRVDLSWNAATDSGQNATGLQGYNVYRNGVFLRQVLAPATSTSDTGLAQMTTYSYQVLAVDRSRNASAKSAPAYATTSSCGCAYAISPQSAWASAAGNVAMINVTAGAGCYWTAGSSASWISVNTTMGSGNGTLSYTVAPNTTTSARSGYLIVAEQVFWLTQEAAVSTCAYSLSSAGSSIGSGGGTVSVDVTTDANCSWNVANANGWISILSGASGNGPGRVTLSVGANTSSSTRSGNLTIAGENYSITQSGVGVDTVAPATSLLSPAEGAVLSGQVQIQSYSTDNAGVSRVEFYVYNLGQWELVCTSSGSGATTTSLCTFNTATVPNGLHYLASKAYDASGNSAWSPMTTVTINNYNADPGVISWVRDIGQSSLTGSSWGNAVKTDNQGNVIVAGKFSGSVNFGGTILTSRGGFDVFVCKYSASGTLLWVRSYGGNVDDTAQGVAVDSGGNVYVTGHFSGTVDFGGGPLTSAGGIGYTDIFVAKYTANGAPVWSKRYGGSYGGNYGYGIAVDRNNDVLFTGSFYLQGDVGGGAISSRGGLDGFVTKLSGLYGTTLWSRGYGSSDADYGKGVAVDANGDVLVTGYAYAGMNFGTGTLPSGGGADAFAAKYSGSSGGLLWAQQMGSSGSDTAEGVAVDNNNNVYITGSFSGSVNFGGIGLTSTSGSAIFTAAFNPNGQGLWARGVSASGPTPAIASRGIAVDSNGNVVLTGNASGEVNFGNGVLTMGIANIFILKYGPGGSYIWSKRFVSTGWCASWAITTDNERNVLATGYFQGATTFDALQLSSLSGQTADAYLMKISP
jgi:CheY-like chemotaxis protein